MKQYNTNAHLNTNINSKTNTNMNKYEDYYEF